MTKLSIDAVGVTFKGYPIHPFRSPYSVALINFACVRVYTNALINLNFVKIIYTYFVKCSAQNT